MYVLPWPLIFVSPLSVLLVSVLPLCNRCMSVSVVLVSVLPGFKLPVSLLPVLNLYMLVLSVFKLPVP